MALPSSLKNLADANSAAIGGLIATVSLYPLDVMKTKSATAKESSGTPIEIIQKTLNSEGLSGFYRGVQFKALQSVLGKFLYFYGYSFLQSSYERKSGKMGTFANLAIGYAAEALSLPITMPIEIIVTQYQTAAKAGQSNLSEIIKAIMGNQGILGLYKGYNTYPFLCLQPAIQYTIFEQIKRMVLKKKGVDILSALEAFLLGALARAIALFLIYPFIRVKVVMQASKNSEKKNQKSIPAFLLKTARDEGVLSLYNGLGWEMLRGVLSSAVMLMVKERVYKSNVDLLVHLAGHPKATS